MPEPAVAFLSKRKLHVRKDGLTQVIDSEFARTVRERAASIERRHAWKTKGRGAMFMAGMWAAQDNGPADVPVLLTGLTAGPEGALLYSMETDAVSGVFLRDATGLETRLFHTADFRVRDTALHPGGTLLAATAFHPEAMRSNIAVLQVHGTEVSEVTEGDSFDQLPQWVPGTARRIVFQSAGIGRNAAGQFAGLGPYAIHELNLDSGDLAEIAAEPSHNLMQPCKAADGTLYYVRKPYESGVPNASLIGSLKDAAMFPFRMALAVFQYFNIFSMMYTGKPLVTNKGAAQRRMDPRQMFILGNLAGAMTSAALFDDGQGLVPPSWELVRQRPAEKGEVIARKVLTFDLAADGGVLHSDGASITWLGPEGRSERMLEGEAIERVLAL